MIDSVWIASKSLVRMLMAAAWAVRGWVACAAHSLKAVWFLALPSATCPITTCHVDSFVAGGWRQGTLFRRRCRASASLMAL